jgi:hypothetical protein
MKTKKTVLIFHETHETLSVHLVPHVQPRRAFVLCEECASEVTLLAPEEAAFVSRLNVRAIYRLVETGLIHFKETADGLLLVCPINVNGLGFDVRSSAFVLR